MPRPDRSAPADLVLAMAYHQSDFKKLLEQKRGLKTTKTNERSTKEGMVR
jgi:hypothetical protein